MGNTIKIALEGIIVHAKHGVYEEEKILGNIFEIDIYLEIVQTTFNDDLNQTVDYEKVHKIIVEQMRTPQHLLETVAQNIANRITSNWQKVKKVHLKIKKKNLPFSGKIKNVTIELSI